MKVTYKKSQYVVNDIYPDDTVHIAALKVAKALNISKIPILFCKKEVKDAKGQLLDNIFKHRKIVSLEQLLSGYQELTGKKLKFGNKDVPESFTRIKAEMALKKLNLKYLIFPMSKAYTTGEDISMLTIETNRPYKKSLIAVDGEGLGVLRNEDELKAFYDEKELDGTVNKFQYNFVHFRVHNQEFASRGSILNTYKLFDKIVPTNAYPFIKWVSSAKTLFKIHDSFAHNVQLISSWTKTDNLNYINNTNELCIVKCYVGNIMITLIFFTKGYYDVKVNLKVGTQITDQQIKKLMDQVNLYITQLLPSFPLVDMAVSNAQRIIASGRIETKRDKISEGQLQNAVKDFMSSFFSVLNVVNGVMTLAYKRGDDFCTEKNALMFLNQQSNATVQKIMDVFMLSKEQAGAVMLSWKEMQKSEAAKNAFVRRKINWILVKIKITNINYLFTIDGATNNNQIRRIIRGLMYLIDKGTQSSNKKATKTLNTNVQIDDVGEDMGGDVEFDLSMFGIDEDKKESAKDEDDEVIEENVAKMKQEKRCPVMFGGTKTQNAKKNGPDMYLLNKLYEADKELFQPSSKGEGHQAFAKICQKSSTRQPIVTNQDELEYNKKCFPGAVSSSVSYGTTEALAKKNRYWCPKVWCPKSRVGMTWEQYIKLGKKCPFKDVKEVPMEFNSPNYWKNNEERKLNFLSPTQHPKGFCMPCCFNKGEVGIDEEPVCEDVVTNPKYIKTEDFPLEKERYGLLPSTLGTFLGNTFCGGKNGTTGLMNEKTNCFLRYGIPLHNQSFLQCIVSSIDNPKLKTIEDIVGKIVDNVDMKLFVTLQEGVLCKTFLSRSSEKYSIEDIATFNLFKTHFLNREKNSFYLESFQLKQVATVLAQTPSFNNKIKYYKDVIREFRLFCAFKEFKEYMLNDNVKKTHDIILGIVQLNAKWMNVNAYNIIVIEQAETSDEFKIESSTTFNKLRPSIFILKQGKYYEPIHYVKNNKGEGGKKKGILGFETKFTTDIPAINDFTKYYTFDVAKHNADEVKIMELCKDGTQAVILDFNLKIIGIVYKDTQSSEVFAIPFKRALPVIHTLQAKYVFVDFYVRSFKSSINKNFVGLTLDKINSFLGGTPYYEYTEKENGTLINCDSCYLNILLKPYNETISQFSKILCDADIFINFKAEDTRTKFIDHQEYIEQLYIFFWNEINNFKNWSNGLEFDEFLKMMRHPANPMSVNDMRLDLKDALEDKLKRVVKVQAIGSGNPKILTKRICSTISNKYACDSPCVYASSMKSGEIKGSHCRLRIPADVYSYILEKCSEDLLNPLVPLEVRDFPMKNKNNDVIIFSDKDLKHTPLETILNSHNVNTSYFRPAYTNLVMLDKTNVVKSDISTVVSSNTDKIPVFLKGDLKEFTLNQLKMGLIDFFHLLQNKINPENNQLSKDQFKDKIGESQDILSLAKVAMINCVYVSRKSDDNPDRVRCFGRFTNIDFYVIIFKSPEGRGNKHPYSLFVKNGQKYILTKSDLPETFVTEYILKKCRTF